MNQSKKETPARKGSGSNVTPEQQELYDIFVSQGTRLAAAASDELKGQGPDTPGIVGTVGDAMVDIINKVEDEGMQYGIKFDEVSLVQGSAEILINFLNMDKINLSEEQSKKVAGHMVGRYIQEAIKSGKMSKEQVVQAAQQLQQSVGGTQQQPPYQQPMQQPPGILQKGQANV